MAKSNRKIYLDYAAGVSANPSSVHEKGVEAKKKLQNARKKVADVLGCQPMEIIFTSGGTESNNLAISGVVLAWHSRKVGPSFKEGPTFLNLPHIITTNIEHPSVLETFRMLEKRKLAEISIVPVEKNGIVDPKKIKKEIKKNTVLVSVMYANNEIGTIQPIKEIAKEIRHYKKAKVGPSLKAKEPTFAFFPLLHVDAVQAVNYLDLNVEKLGVDLLSLSGSKIEGAGRVGVLYKRRTVLLSPIFGGGDQENGLRPGTENLPEILKFSSALESIQKNKEKENKRLTSLRDYFFKKIKVFNFLLNGDLENRLPNNINITFPKIPSELLVIELSAKGIMASAKSACESSRKEGSYVIDAIRNIESQGEPSGNFPEGSPWEEEIGGLRFSLGKKTTKADIDYTVKTLSQILQKLKKWYY